MNRLENSNKMSKIRTYSKCQKTVDCPDIFLNVDSNKMELSFEKEKSIDSRENNKRSLRNRKQLSKESMPEEQPATASKLLSKRKVTIENKENKTQESTNSLKTQKQTLKFFQNSNIDYEHVDNDPEIINQNNLMLPPVLEKKERGRPSSKTKKKNTLRSASSASNLPVRKSNAKTSGPEIKEAKSLTKSNSVSNLNNFPPQNAVSNSVLINACDSNTFNSFKELQPNLKKEIEVKKILETETTKTKRAIRILEKINDKNDQLTNLRIDNKTKHSASTSTPSGARRRPLKAPQDVSLIVKF